jgi:hypothetical protein
MAPLLSPHPNTRYKHIPGEFDYHTFRPYDMFVSFPVMLVAFLGLAHLVREKHDHIKLIGFFIVYGVVLAGLGYLCRRLLKKDYTALPVAEGTILIVRDKNHARILAELQSRRMAALREYAVIDPMILPKQNMAKFEWLLDQGVISAEEFAVYKDHILSSAEQATSADKAEQAQRLN